MRWPVELGDGIRAGEFTFTALLAVTEELPASQRSKAVAPGSTTGQLEILVMRMRSSHSSVTMGPSVSDTITVRVA